MWQLLRILRVYRGCDEQLLNKVCFEVCPVFLFLVACRVVDVKDLSDAF